MKLLAGLVFIMFVNHIKAQNDSVQNPNTSITENISAVQNVIMEYDKIKLDNGDSIIVNIIAETQTEVAFKYPFNTVINKVTFSRIKEIDYKNGKTKLLHNQVAYTGVGAEADNLWRIVLVTNDENEISGLKEIGPINAKAEGKTYRTSIDLLEKNATVNIKKAAVRMNATKVLVLKKNIEQSYGEIPMVEIEGVAYGAE